MWSTLLFSVLGASSAIGFSTEDTRLGLGVRSFRDLDALSDLALIRRDLVSIEEGGAARLRLQKRVEGEKDAPTDKFVNNQLTKPIQGLPDKGRLESPEKRIRNAKQTPLTGQTQDTQNPKVIQDFNTESGKNIVASRTGTRMDQPHDVRSKATTESKKRTDRGEAFDNQETKKMRKDKQSIEQGRPSNDKNTFTDEKEYHSWEKKPGEKTVTNQVSAQEQRKIEAGPVKKTNKDAREQKKPAEQRLKNIPKDVKDSTQWKQNVPARMENTPERSRTPESPVSPGKTPPPINTGSKQGSPEPATKRQKLNTGGGSPTGSPTTSPKSQTSTGSVGTKRKSPSKRDLASLYRRHLQAKVQRRHFGALDRSMLAY